MFAHPEGGAHKGVSGIAGLVDIHVGVIGHGHRAAQLSGKEVLFHGAFDGFVVLGEGTVGPARTEDLGMSLGFHDKGVLALGVGGAVRVEHGRPPSIGNVPDPAALSTLGVWVPGNHWMFRIPGFAVRVHRCAIVDNAPVYRPTPGPFKIETYAGLFSCTPGRHVAFLSV